MLLLPMGRRMGTGRRRKLCRGQQQPVAGDGFTARVQALRDLLRPPPVAMPQQAAAGGEEGWRGLRGVDKDGERECC